MPNVGDSTSHRMPVQLHTTSAVASLQPNMYMSAATVPKFQKDFRHRSNGLLHSALPPAAHLCRVQLVSDGADVPVQCKLGRASELRCQAVLLAALAHARSHGGKGRTVLKLRPGSPATLMHTQGACEGGRDCATEPVAGLDYEGFGKRGGPAEAHAISEALLGRWGNAADSPRCRCSAVWRAVGI